MPATTPQQMHALFIEAFNAGEVEALLALYEPGAVFVADGQPVTGHAAIRSALEGSLAMKAEIAIETALVVESGDGLALLHGLWTVHPAEGKAMSGISSEVARRQADGTWLYVLDNPGTPQ